MNKDNLIITISSIYPDSLKEYLLKNGAHLDLAGHTFENAVLSGLGKLGVSYSLISAPLINGSSKINKYLKGYKFKSNPNILSNDIYIGNICIPFINKIYEYFAIRRELLKQLKKNPNASLLIFSLHSPFLLAYYSLFRTKISTCVVVYDLPQYMSENKSKLYRFAKKIDQYLINKCLKKIDSYVLLSVDMINFLPKENKKWEIIEGIYNTTNSIMKSNEYEESNDKIILYTGGISERYGVFDLIEAFVRIPQSYYKLILCGNCSNHNLLNEYLDKDKRISYLGLVDKKEVAILQSRATVLVNPRHSGEEFTKYSFPSKTMEYMASGTPTIMCKLHSLPNEYLEYLFIFEDESIEGYKNKIVEVCSKPSDYLSNFGNMASNFIKSKKNEIIQAKKIVDLLSKQ